MAGIRISRALAPATLLFMAVHTDKSIAEPAVEALPQIVVIATRSPLDSARAGSSVSVIEAAEIEKLGSKGLGDVLRAVPGLDISETGGIGSASYAKLRGSSAGQTLILVDGIRMGDPTGVNGALDLGALAVGDIERIEILRGPQSALYGSDAMGGVINIITRRGGAQTRRSALVEGGSYGTLHARGAVSGSVDRLSYAFSVDMLHADGFARYVDRAQVRAGTWPAIPKNDPTDRVGVNARVSYRIGDGFEIETGVMAHFNRIAFDNPFAFVPANVYDRFNQSKQWTGSIFTRAGFEAFGGQLKNQLTLFANRVDRSSGFTESCLDFVSNCNFRFRGNRSGAEYQGDLKLGAYGLLVFGARTETETAATSEDYPVGYAGAFFKDIAARQTTNSVFAIHQFALGENMDISLGGRVDAVVGGRTFPTWRATWAYRLPDSGTKFRASAGTGAKTPSLYQRFSEYGKPNLSPERSVGYDVGIDQSLLQGRLNLSASLFYNKYRDLIDFGNSGCTATQPFGCYFNVGRAVTYGAELSADAIIVPDAWRARVSFTHLIAKDELANAKLLQRPRNKGFLSVIYTGLPKLEVEGRVTLVGGKLDFGFPSPIRIAPYARFDMLANYKLNDTFSIFGRIENLSNSRYEEVFNYRVAGRSFYAGLKATW